MPETGLRWKRTAAGLVATCSVTAMAAVSHLIVYRLAFPAQAIAQNAVGATSGRVESFFVQLLGHWAQRLLVIGLSALFALSGALLAHLIPRRVVGERWAWALVPVPLWAATVVMYSVPQPFLPRGTFALASLPMFLVGGWLGGLTYSRIEGSPRREAARGRVESPLSPGVTRRSFLAALGLGGVGVAVGASGLASLIGGPIDTGAIPLGGARVARARRPSPAPDDTAFAAIVGLTPEVTSTQDFYVVDKDILNPVLNPSTWRLRVQGLVETPLDLTYRDLRSMRAYERFQTLECISNRVGGHLMSTALWTGVPLKDVLGRAGVKPAARTVVFRAAGGYSESHSVEKAMDPTTLIAIGMNRHELPRAHGFPARLLTVGTYGMKNPKWLTDIELVEGGYRGYWELRGWAPDVDPKITTRIDVPANGDRIGSTTVIAGIAFAGDRGISRVQVSADGGRSWDDARLKTALSPYTWRLWMYEWRAPEPGTYRILARSVDGRGRVQASTPKDPFPSGAAGLEGITVRST